MFFTICIIVLLLILIGRYSSKKAKHKSAYTGSSFFSGKSTKKAAVVGGALFVLGSAINNKITELRVEYTGDTRSGVIIDAKNPGVIVKGLTANGKQKDVTGWTIDEPKELREDATVVVLIRYKKLCANLTVKCSSSAVTDIFAQYKGPLTDGTTINTAANAVSVFARHKNGSISNVTQDCLFQPAYVTLKRDGKERIMIRYGIYSCFVDVECSDKMTASDSPYIAHDNTDYQADQQVYLSRSGNNAIAATFAAIKNKIVNFYYRFKAFPSQKQALYGAITAAGVVLMILSLIFLHRIWAVCLALSAVFLVVYTVKENKNNWVIGTSVAAAGAMLLCSAFLFTAGQNPRLKAEKSNVPVDAAAGIARNISETTQEEHTTTPPETTTKETVPTTVATTAPATTETTTKAPTTEPPTTEPPTTQPPTTEPPTTEAPTEPLTAAPTEPVTSPPTEKPQAEIHDYIGNANTGKFHYPNCSSVSRMKESNKVYCRCTRDEMLARGFEPCKNCNP